jgi:hypothetical protein
MPPAERIDATVVAQVWLAVSALRADPLIGQSGAMVTGGRYSLATGVVTPLPQL